MNAATNETIAVYGGSFDPPHIGHTLVAAYVLSAHAVDRVLVMPTARHPFSKNLASFEDRVAMCKIAMRDLPRVEVSTLENELEGPSLTLHTLEALTLRCPHARLRLVLGSDLLPETSSWHAFDRICAVAPLIVVKRSGFPHPQATGLALPEISSTDAQKLLRSGASTEGALDPEVARYACARSLYR